MAGILLTVGLVSIGSCSPGGRVVISAGVACGTVDLRYSSRISHQMVGTGWWSTLQWAGLLFSGRKLPAVTPEDWFPVSGFMALVLQSGVPPCRLLAGCMMLVCCFRH